MVRFFAPSLAVGLTAFLASPGRTQEPPPALSVSVVLSVEDAVRLAVQNHPRLAASARDVAAAALEVRSARALVNPNAFFAPGITSVSGVGEEFLIQQPLEIGGTRVARSRVARAGQQEAEARALSSLRETVYAAKVAYYELGRARQLLSVASDALALASEFDRIARRQVEEGVRPGINLAQTGLEVSRTQVQVTLARSREEAARAALNSALGRGVDTFVSALSPLTSDLAPLPDAGRVVVPPVEAALSLPNSPAPTPPADLSTAALLSQAVSARSEIAGGAASAERFRAEAALTRAEGRPDIVPQFRVGYFTRGPQKASSGNGAGIGVAITLPLLDYGGRRLRVRQVEELALAQDARVASVRRDIEREAAQAIARERAARAAVEAYRIEILPQAQRLLDGSRSGFRQGRTDVTALLEAGRSFRSVQSEYVNVLTDAALARAELERATGAVTPGNFLKGINP